MLIGCEFKRIKSAVGFETMLLFLQCSETLRASPQDTYACHVSFNNFGFINEFFQIRNSSFEEVWVRPSC